MLIWLGKQWLGQSEKPSADVAEPEISDEIEALLAELDEVEVKGRQSVDTLLGCMMAIDAIIGEQKNVE